MATHSSILAWKALWMEELADYLPGSHRESDTPAWVHSHTADVQGCVNFRRTAKWVSSAHTYTPTLRILRLFSHVGHYRVLSRVPRAPQEVPVCYLLYREKCVYANPSLPIYPSLLPPSTHAYFLQLWRYFCSVNKFICTFFFFNSTYKLCHMTFVFLCLTYQLFDFTNNILQ